ncbi:MAG: glutathione S-transferase family protein [Porticoccaceae bacterium]
MSITLWHCRDSRSLRPLWLLEEMQLQYTLVDLPFPPRVFDKSYLQVNPLGTVPFFRDDTSTATVEMTESTAICHYLVERYKESAPSLALTAEDAEYGDYLNWLYHADATLTFPQALMLRYGKFETAERRSEQVAEDYRHWYLSRLRKLETHLLGRQYLVAERFTIADIAIGYALYLGEFSGAAQSYSPLTLDYLQRLKQRAAFQRSARLGAKGVLHQS